MVIALLTIALMVKQKSALHDGACMSAGQRLTDGTMMTGQVARRITPSDTLPMIR